MNSLRSGDTLADTHTYIQTDRHFYFVKKINCNRNSQYLSFHNNIPAMPNLYVNMDSNLKFNYKNRHQTHIQIHIVLITNYKYFP